MPRTIIRHYLEQCVDQRRNGRALGEHHQAAKYQHYDDDRHLSPSVELKHSQGLKTAMALAPALWPALFPMWFIEMGRLGNDCLVTLWAACAAILISRLNLKAGLINDVLLGIVCAFGLLAKATFLPITAAILLFLFYRTWTARGDTLQFQDVGRGLAAFVAIVIVISGWWYGKNLYDTGSLIGANDELQLSEKGNALVLALNKLQTIPPRVLIGELVAVALTFVWGGTWSFVMPSLLSELPLLILLFVIVVAYLRAIVRTPPSGSELIYPLTLVLFLAGLFTKRWSILLSMRRFPSEPIICIR